MVDAKGIGQLFMLKGTAEQDFGEWTHKVRMFMLADSHCSDLGSTTAEDRCQDLCSFAERPLCAVDHCLLENRPSKMNRSTTLMTLLES